MESVFKHNNPFWDGELKSLTIFVIINVLKI
jgi:hypothetical protein